MRVAVFGIAGLLAACGDNVTPSFSERLLEASCGYMVRCGEVSNVEDCVAIQLQGQAVSPDVAIALRRGTLDYDPIAAHDCVEAYDQLPCDKTAQAADALAACNKVYVGQLVDGKSCAFDRECKSDLCVKPSCSAACCIGACEARPQLPGDGQPCLSLCADALYCGADDRCHPYGAAGDPCSDVVPCGYAMECVGRTPTMPGTCEPWPHDGESCTALCAEEGSQCQGGTCSPVALLGEPCDDQHVCSWAYTCTAAGTCGEQATLDPKRNGDLCSHNNECASRYCDTYCAEPPRCY